jgi:hypothetical protein
MKSYDLSGIPIPDRELMEINQRQVMQILEEIDRLQAIASDKSNPKSASAAKRLTNATRALADVVSTPELFAGYTPTKNIKYIGEGYYGVGKKFLEDMQLDPMGYTGGKSTMHHNDSLKQLFRAIYDPDPNIRYQVIQGLREAKEGDIGSTLQNLSDTEAKGGHRIYHADPNTGKTDYKNKASTAPTLELGPNSTVKERVAGGAESMRIQGGITRAAQVDPLVVARNNSILEDIAANPEGKKLLDRFGDPLDINNPLRTPEVIKQFRDLNIIYKPVLTTVNGKAQLLHAVNPFAAPVDMIMKNPFGALMGAANFVEPESIKALFQGKPGEAAKQAVMGAGVGALAQSVLSSGTALDAARLAQIPGASNVATAAGKVLGPAAAAYTGYQVADAILEGATGEGFVGTMQQVKDKKRTAKINQQLPETVEILRQQALAQGKPDPMRFSNTIEKVVTDPLNELEYLGKQVVGGLKTVGGAVLFGF